MQLPDIKECFNLMERYEMLPNIKKHSIVVAKIAEQIIDELLQTKIDKQHLPSRELVITGALLHDIAKTTCIKNGGDHATLGAEICNKHNYFEISTIISEHVILSSHETDRHKLGHFDAREIVYYADKRVMHDDIVDLSTRLDYILKTYGNNDPRVHLMIKDNFADCQTLEKHLFNFLPFSPKELPDKVLNCKSSDITAAMQ